MSIFLNIHERISYNHIVVSKLILQVTELKMIGTENFTVFDGRNWETSSFVNFMASRGFKAPHSGMPYSEALLMGVSGGAVMGYFSFAYEGYDPMCRILTRNTFDP